MQSPPADRRRRPQSWDGTIDAMDDEGIASPGPGSGGSPAPSGEPDPDERAEAASDPQVKALVEELRSDRDAVEVPVDDAAEQAGSGTDR